LNLAKFAKYNLSGGSLVAAVVNDGQFNYTGGTYVGSMTNTLNGTVAVFGGGSRTITGSVTNNGTFHVTNTDLTVNGTFVNNGAYISDPSTNRLSSLSVGSGGYLAGSVGDRFLISGSLTSNSTQRAAWNTLGAELEFTAGTAAAHTLSLTGADLGPSDPAGYVKNYAWGLLTLDSGQSLILQDGNAVPGGALYLEALVLAEGIGQVGSITGNGLNIYYDGGNPANAYLANQTYPLIGGGQLAPTVPEPAGLSLLVLSASGLLCRRRRGAT
jgi:hypothetical protein